MCPMRGSREAGPGLGRARVIKQQAATLSHLAKGARGCQEGGDTSARRVGNRERQKSQMNFTIRDLLAGRSFIQTWCVATACSSPPVLVGSTSSNGIPATPVTPWMGSFGSAIVHALFSERFIVLALSLQRCACARVYVCVCLCLCVCVCVTIVS